MNQPQPNITNPSDHIHDTLDVSFTSLQGTFYSFTIDNDIDSINSFLNGPSSALYFQFNYDQSISFLPNDIRITPLIVAIINNQLSISKLLIHQQHHNQQFSPKSTEKTTSTTSFDPSTYKEHGFPLLFYAIASGCIEMIDYILSLYSTQCVSSSSSSSSSSPSTTPQHISFIDTITSTTNLNPLQFATSYLELQQVKYLIEHYKCNTLVIDQNGQTILHYAVLNKKHCFTIIEYLLTLNDVKNLLEHKNNKGETILLTLTFYNQHESIRYLIQHYKPNISTTNDAGFTIAHFLARNGNIDLIDYIHNINSSLIHQVCPKNFSPASTAAHYNQLPMLQHLITKYNVDYHRITYHDENILHVSMERGSIELIDYIINLDQSFLEAHNDQGTTPLWYACQYGNVTNFNHLLNQHHANPFSLNCFKMNLMHFAAMSNNIQMIQTILHLFETSKHINQITMNNIDYTLPDNGYKRLTGEWFDDVASPLHWAIDPPKLDSVKQLIRLKANITPANNISSVTRHFDTILHYSYRFAHEKNDYSIFEYLLSDECLADWNSEELKFHDDEDYGQKDPIQPQLEITSSSQTLLFHTASQYDFTAMKLLIERGANVYVIGKYSTDLLSTLITDCPQDQQFQNHLLEFLNYLFSIPTIDVEKLVIKQPSSKVLLPLQTAVCHASFPIIHKLINSKANINDTTAQHNSLLHFASNNGHFSLVSDFVQHYPQFTQQQLYKYNSFGLMPFHMSVCAPKKQHVSIPNDIVNGHNNNNNNTIIIDTNNNPNGDNDDDEFNFYNPDISTFIKHNPKLLFQLTTSKKTILHLCVQTEDELSTRLAGLIEAFIDNPK